MESAEIYHPLRSEGCCSSWRLRDAIPVPQSTKQAGGAQLVLLLLFLLGAALLFLTAIIPAPRMFLQSITNLGS